MPAELPKVTLRPKRLEDAELDYQWQTDPEFASLHAKEALTLSFAQFQEEYAEVFKNRWPGRLHFAIETEQGLCIGDCACHNIRHDEAEGEVGINIARREYWGKGYGAAALSQFVEYIFSCTGLKKLKLRTLEGNLRAQRSFIRAGFRPAGVLEDGGHRFLRMELSREEWLKMTGHHDRMPADSAEES
jgi:[ribosomal protein S5]-alanine N-acetyltransferase